jgi:hypothetical protein
MKRFKSILCASLITIALSSSALAGDITTGKAPVVAGDITTGKAPVVTGDITTGKAGVISIGKAGVISIGKATDAGVEALLILISLAF